MKISSAKTFSIISLLMMFFPLNTYADVMLHAFNWSYKDITLSADKIESSGYKMVLVYPPMKANNAEGCPWWRQYQPQDYRVIDNCAGNKADFIEMIAAMKARDISVYADLVLNHMENNDSLRSGLIFPGEKIQENYCRNTTGYWEEQRLFGQLCQDNILFAEDFHNAFCITPDDYNNSNVWQIQTGRLCNGGSDKGLPDIAATDRAISVQQKYIQSLKDLGISGLRLDAAKHLSIWHINRLFNEILYDNSGNALNDGKTLGEVLHVFGESIVFGGPGVPQYDRLLRPIMEQTSIAALDFPLFTTIKNVFSVNGSLRDLVNPENRGLALDKFRAVTFAVNHDFPNNGSFQGNILQVQDEHLAHAYILGRDGGVPMIFSEKNMPLAEPPRDRLNGRNWVDFYERFDITRMIWFHNKMQGQGQDLLAVNDCALLFRRGEEGIVGINKCLDEQRFTVDTNFRFKWFRDYRDVFTGKAEVKISSDKYTFVLPGRQAKMWYVD